MRSGVCAVLGAFVIRWFHVAGNKYIYRILKYYVVYNVRKTSSGIHVISRLRCRRKRIGLRINQLRSAIAFGSVFDWNLHVAMESVYFIFYSRAGHGESARYLNAA
jgi:hypothetical protein